MACRLSFIQFGLVHPAAAEFCFGGRRNLQVNDKVPAPTEFKSVHKKPDTYPDYCNAD